MAIIIPSKNIYDKDNPKVRDNLIDKIEVGATEITPSNDYEIAVFNENFNGSVYDGNKFFYDMKLEILSKNTGQGVFKDYCSYIRITPYYNDFKIKIPRKKNNKYIEKIQKGLDKDDEPYIKCQIGGDIYEGTAEAVVKRPAIDVKSLSDLKTVYGDTKKSTYYESKIEIETKTYDYVYGDDDYSDSEQDGKITSQITNFIDYTDLSGNYDFTEEEDFFSFGIVVLSGYEIITMGGKGVEYFSTDAKPPSDFGISGNCKKYIPKSIEITIYGNTIGIDINKTTITLGEGNKPLSFDGNELMQVTNYFVDTINPSINSMYEKTKSIYKNGKETATILCSITDYYNNKGEKVIDINSNNMSFHINDIVEPYIYGANGEDKPMSKYKDGSSKEFKVIGTNIIYDGAVWQELTLQEITKGDNN